MLCTIHPVRSKGRASRIFAAGGDTDWNQAQSKTTPPAGGVAHPQNDRGDHLALDAVMPSPWAGVPGHTAGPLTATAGPSTTTLSPETGDHQQPVRPGDDSSRRRAGTSASTAGLDDLSSDDEEEATPVLEPVSPLPSPTPGPARGSRCQDQVTELIGSLCQPHRGCGGSGGGGGGGSDWRPAPRQRA